MRVPIFNTGRLACEYSQGKVDPGSRILVPDLNFTENLCHRGSLRERTKRFQEKGDGCRASLRAGAIFCQPLEFSARNMINAVYMCSTKCKHCRIRERGWWVFSHI